MSTEDLRLLNAALTAHENWLLLDEVRELHNLKRQVEIGWPLSIRQRDSVEQMVARSRARRGTETTPA